VVRTKLNTVLVGYWHRVWPGCYSNTILKKKRGYRVCSSGYAATDTS
jgi:hypothetical protein